MFWALILTVLSLSAAGAESRVNWVPTWEEALEKAAAGEKFIVLDISASWCGPCQKLAREVYPDPRFVEFSKDHVFMLLDAEQDPEGVKLANRFKVGGYPSIIVFDHQGKEIDRLVGGRDVIGLMEDLNLIFEFPVDLKRLRDRARGQADDFALQRAAGLRCFFNKEYDEASRFLDRAIRLAEGQAPQKRRLLTYKARADLEEGRYEASWAAFEAAGSLAPTASPQAWIQLLKAECLIGLKRHDEAKAILDPLLGSHENGDEARELLNKLPKSYRIDDKRFTELLERAEKKLEKKDLEEALEAASQACGIYADSARAHLLRAQSLMGLHARASGGQHYTDGINAALRALRLAPDDTAVQKAVRELFAPPEPPPAPLSKDGPEKFKKAEKAFEERQYRKAADLYLELLRAEPTYAPAARRLGAIFYLHKQYENSSELYRQAAALEPSDAEAHRYAADSYKMLGQVEDARRHVYACIQADPSYPLCWFDLLALLDGKDTGFERHAGLVPLELYLADPENYEKAFDSIPPETAPAWTEYYKVKLDWRRERFARLHPGTPFRHTPREELEGLSALAAKWEEMRLQSPDLKDPELDFLLQLSVQDRFEPFVYYEMFNELYRADFERWKKENPQGLANYLDGFVLEPQVTLLGRGHNNVASRVFNRGVELHDSDPAAAVPFYEEALRMEPWMRPALVNLTQAYLRLGLNEKAESLLGRWSEGRPRDPLPLDALAGLRFNQGSYEEAVELAERALALAEDAAEKERISENLEFFKAAPRP